MADSLSALGSEEELLKSQTVQSRRNTGKKLLTQIPPTTGATNVEISALGLILAFINKD